jgi:uncharacterized repeat protein (TIGR03943 family)
VNARAGRFLPAATLLVWGGVLLAYWFSGRVDDLLVPVFRPWVLVSGAALVGMAAIWWGTHRSDDDCCGHDHDDGGGFTRWISAAILILPIVTAALFSPGEFGAKAVANRGVILDAEGFAGGKVATEGLSITPGRHVEVVDLLYAAQDPVLQKDFAGREVEIVGQWIEATSNNPNGNRVKLLRMFMVCCAADARPVAVLVEPAAKPSTPPMSWVKAVGTVTFVQEAGRTLALLTPATLEPTSPPDEALLY